MIKEINEKSVAYITVNNKRLIPKYKNSYLAPKLKGMKQKKLHQDKGMTIIIIQIYICMRFVLYFIRFFMDYCDWM